MRLYVNIRESKESHYSSNNHKFIIDAGISHYDISGDLVFYDFVKSPTTLIEVRISVLMIVVTMMIIVARYCSLFQGFVGLSPLS